MNEDIQKEMMFASGALVAFVAFLIVGGISEIADMAISVGAFAVSWFGVSYFIKNYGPGGASKQDLATNHDALTLEELPNVLLCMPIACMSPEL